jgi:hypothetical protein
MYSHSYCQSSCHAHSHDGRHDRADHNVGSNALLQVAPNAAESNVDPNDTPGDSRGHYHVDLTRDHANSDRSGYPNADCLSVRPSSHDLIVRDRQPVRYRLQTRPLPSPLQLAMKS